MRKGKKARVVTWLALLLGTMGSIVFNVMDTVTRTSSPIAAYSSCLWPLINMAAVEIVVIVAWPRGLVAKMARFGGVGGVGVVSMVISYGHIHDVMRSWGESPLAAMVGPIAIDGLMLLSSAALLVMRVRPPTTQARRATKSTARKRTTARRSPALKAA